MKGARLRRRLELKVAPEHRGDVHTAATANAKSVHSSRRTEATMPRPPRLAAPPPLAQSERASGRVPGEPAYVCVLVTRHAEA